MFSRVHAPQLIFFLFAVCGCAWAHVDSPDVFFEGKAGPYPVMVTVRPPNVIPGIAEVEVRVAAEGVRQVKVVPMPLVGPAAKLPPTPDIAVRSKDDPEFYTSSVWLMAVGSYQVRIQVEGAQGDAALSVPVPAIARSTKTMDKPLGAILAGLMALLAVGLVSIYGAASREARLGPGEEPTPGMRMKARWIMGVASVIVLGIIAFGSWWWTAEASDYGSHIYKPLNLAASVENGKLMLRLSDPGWFRMRKLDDFAPDHGHLMHLFVVAMPAMDRMWHLHPEQLDTGVFATDAPAMPAGQYRFFADVVHGSGFPETPVADVMLPEITGRPLGDDDAAASAPPLAQAGVERTASALSGGYRMVWERSANPLRAKQVNHFVFRVEDAAGRPAEDLQMYMGMAGHAEFVSADGSVFAHVHPSGSAPMPALALANGDADPMAGMDHSGGHMRMPAEVAFPYGFPKAGRYRIFVQVKRAGRVETGVFDATVL